VADVELKREGGIAYREAIPAGEEIGDPLLLVHGFPQSSYMWESVVRAVADVGRRAVAPDLPGYGVRSGASRRPAGRHQVVGLVGVRTHTSKNALRSWPETSSKTAWKSSVVAVESS